MSSGGTILVLLRRAFASAVCVLFLAVPAWGDAPVIDVFTVPDEGVGPLPVDIIVRANSVHGGKMFCKLSYRGDNGPFESENRFTLEPPYEEVVFTHVYESSARDYRPTVVCQDVGIGTDSSPVTVRPAVTQAPPTVVIEATAGDWDARFPLEQLLLVDDADGDSLRCSVDFGEFGGEVTEVTVEPPYAPVVLTHRYGRAGTYQTQVSCSDGAGNSALGSVAVRVVQSPGNSAPRVDLRRLSPLSGAAPRTVDWRIQGMSDANGDTLNCRFDAKDGEGPRPFTVAPPYPDVDFRVTYREHFELAFPVVDCNDGRGGAVTDQDYVTVTFPSGNRHPNVQVTASTGVGESPLSVTFQVAASDPDGDRLDCEFRYGQGQGVETYSVTPGSPARTFQHTYSERDTYQASVSCRESRAGFAQHAQWVRVDPRDPPDNYAPIVRLEASPDSGDASLGVSLFLSGKDADGDDVACTLDYGDGSAPQSMGLEAPLYSNEWFPHTYFSARSEPFHAVVSCEDGQGGTAVRSALVQVNRPAGSQLPVIDAFDVALGGDGTEATFGVGAHDVDSAQLACRLEYGDGSSYEFVGSVPVALSRTHRYATGSYTARLRCCDDAVISAQCGPENLGQAEASLRVLVGSGNGSPRLHVTASVTSGPADLRVSFVVNVGDRDGDMVSCTLDPGQGQELQHVSIGMPYEPETLRHVYRESAAYEARVVCQDGRGGVADQSLAIWVDAPLPQADVRPADLGGSHSGPTDGSSAEPSAIPERN